VCQSIDEMGLGKTIQVIKFLSVLTQLEGNFGPHLIVGPLSVISNWCREFQQFTSQEFIIHVYYGSKRERQEQFRFVCSQWKYKKPLIILTTYQMIIQDCSFIKQIHRFCSNKQVHKQHHKSHQQQPQQYGFEYMIIDEAQRIKNSHCLLYSLLQSISSKYRILLSGTPIQNNLQELWSLLHFLVPHIFIHHQELYDSLKKVFISNNTDYSHTTTNTTNSIDHPSTNTGPSSSLSSSASASVTYRKLNSKYDYSYERMFQSKDHQRQPSQSSQEQSLSSLFAHPNDQQRLIMSFQTILKPFILRRLKAEVALDIPPKVVFSLHFYSILYFYILYVYLFRLSKSLNVHYHLYKKNYYV
jgi:SNF2 family DNA or RNA helicase